MVHHARMQPAMPPASESSTLGQQVPDELTPRGAHGQPHRDFLRPRGAAHQQQRGQVAARDGEDEADDDEHTRRDRHERRVRLGMDPHVRRGNDRDARATANSAPPRTSSGRSAASRGARTSIAAFAPRSRRRADGLSRKRGDDRGAARIAGMAFSSPCGHRQPEIDETDVERAAVIRGPMPTIVTGAPSIRTMRPRMEGSARNTRVHA